MKLKKKKQKQNKRKKQKTKNVKKTIQLRIYVALYHLQVNNYHYNLI